MASRGPGAPEPRLRRPWPLAIAIFVTVAALFAATVVSTDIYRTGLASMSPTPDAAEYFCMMRCIHEGYGPMIWVAGELLPSRYPLGYAALGAPLLAVLPEVQWVHAPFLVNMTCGAATLALVLAYFTRRGEVWRGAIAALLIASMPAFMTLSRSSMSEPSGALLVVAAFLAMHSAYLGSRTSYLVSAALLGLSLNMRISLVFFMPMLAAPMLFRSLGGTTTRVALIVAGGAVFAFCAAPMAIMNSVNFGNPLTTGYSLWVPWADQLSEAFGPKYVAGNAAMIWHELSLQRPRFVVAHIFGTGTHFVPAFALLVALFAWPPRWTSFHCIACVSMASALAMSLAYFWLDLRLFYPFMLLAAIAVSGGLARVLADWRTGMPRLRATGAALLLLGAIAGFPSRSGVSAGWGRSQLVDSFAWVWEPRNRYQFQDFEVASEARTTIGTDPALILTDLNPAYLASILDRRIICAPPDGDHQFNQSEMWKFDSKAAERLVAGCLDSHVPVYAIAHPLRRSPGFADRLPKIAGHGWVPMDTVRENAAQAWRLAPQR